MTETKTITRMRKAFETFADSYEDLKAAIHAAWEVEREHGAAHWERVCNEQIGDVRERIPKGVRRTLVNELTREGLSRRDVAAAFGIGVATVDRDLGGGVPRRNTKPDLDDDAEVEAEFANIASAMQSAELESVRAELAEARAEVAKLKRLSALEGELNELRTCAIVVGALARKHDIPKLSELADNLKERARSIEEKLK